MQVIATFATSHAALAAERQLLGQGLAVELIPVPRQIRSDCGFGLLAEVAGTGEAGAGQGLGPLYDCGAREIWRVRPDPGPGRTKSYERCP
jgi:hypothetical protein